MVERIDRVEGVAAPLGPYALATVAGAEVHVSGQPPVDAAGAIVGADVEVQARQVYRNLELVLAAAGCGWEQVLKLTVYLTDMADLPGASSVRRELLPAGALPASTVVEVTRLADPGWLIEVEAIARRDG